MDLTTELNFELEPTVLKGEVVTVTAQRPIIEKSATASISITTAEELENIPVRGTQNIIATMAGVVVQDGNVHIRGGRDDEVKFFLNGVSTVNPMNNTNVVSVIHEAVEEIQVLAGGYNADMGGANSGVVRTELKTGASKFQGSLDIRTDGFGDPEEGNKFLNTYTYGHRAGIVTLGGPLISKKARFFIAGEYNNREDSRVRYSKGFLFEDMVDNNPHNAIHDTVTLEYPDGFTPKQNDERYTLNGTVTLDLPVRLNFGFAYTTRKYDITDQPMLRLLNDRTPYNENNTLLLTGRATKIFSPGTFLELRASSYNYFLERGDSWFDHDWHVWYDSTEVYNYSLDKYGGDSSLAVTYRNAWNPKYNYRFCGIPFNRNGAPNDYYFKQKQSYYGFGADFVTQMGRHHEIKTGLDYRAYTIRRFAIYPDVMSFTAEDGTMPYPTYGSIENIPANVWMDNGLVRPYGYDIYGNEIDESKSYYKDAAHDTLLTRVDGPKKPMEFSTYLMDKIEYNDLIINAGVRLDYFDSDDKELKDPGNPEVDRNAGMLKESAWKKLDPEIIISPRLGFSFPVTDKTVFYTQYGKFVQMPSYNNIYFPTYEYARQIVRQGYYYINPIGFGLKPIKTTSYEVGLRQQIAQMAGLDVTAFYKNVKGLVEVIKQLPDQPSSIPGYYDLLSNGDFATNKGIELRLTIRRWNRLAGQINYTYTDAEGTQSTSTSAHGALYFNSQMPTIINPLEYSQTHRGSINLDYRFGINDGGPLLSQLGFNLLFQFNSGHPFTYVFVPPGGQTDAYTAGTDYMLDTRDRWPAEPIGSSSTPWVYYADLRIDKTFSIKNISATFYVMVNNLFNRKNVVNVHWVTGSPSDDGFLSDPDRSASTISANGGQKFIDLYNAINLENGQAYWDAVGNELYGRPRQIFFGIKFNI